MAVTGARAAAAPGASPRIGRRDVVVMVALLVITIVPVFREAVGPPQQLGPEARMSLGWETINRRAAAEGSLPLWNPYQFGGRPHLANPDTLALYPPHVALRLLPLPLFFVATFVLHAWLAAAGTYMTARSLQASRLASAAAGGAVLCGGLLMPFGEIAYSRDVYWLAWLPVIAAGVLRSAERPAWLPHPGLVLAVALGLTASPRSPMYVVTTMVAAYGFTATWQRTPERRIRRVVAQAAVLAGLGIGLAAFQLAPAVRLWATMRGANELAASVRASGERTFTPDQWIADTLRPQGVPHGRIVSACDRALDGTQLVALGAPGVGGYGGALLADYARFASLVRGPKEPVRAVFVGIPEAADGPARVDLLSLLGVEYLVACEPPDPQRWTLVQERGGVGVYRGVAPARRAFWTCAPVPVGRDEMEHRLRRGDYDPRLVLQPDVIIHVRWPAGTRDQDKARAESDLHLLPQRDLDDRTWQYNLLDRSPTNIAAIVQHPLVEDTQGIDRGTLVLTAAAEKTPDFDEPKTEWLMGGDACDVPAPATVRTRDRFDGGMSVDVTAPRDGMVFFSETYYRDRRAWVDGRRIRPMKVNLAFTGVRVPAGTHRVELRYDTRALWAGGGVSLITVFVWIAAARRSRSAARQ